MSIKIVQIGAGIRGRHWAGFVKAHPDVAHVGLVEPDAVARTAAESIIGDRTCRSFADLEQAVTAVEADAALIVAPSAVHADLAIRCMEAGLTVMVEKPLAATVADGLRVLERAQVLGKQVVVAENYRYFPAERTVRKLLADGLVGTIDNAVMIDRRHQPSHTEGPWLASIDYPQLQEIAAHHFDSMRCFFGQRPDAITVRVWNPPGSDYKHGAHSEAFVDFGAVRVQYVGTLLSHRFGFSLWIEGEHGVLWTNRRFVAWRPRGSRWFRPVRNIKVPPGDDKKYPQGGTTSLLDSLRDAVVHGRVAETTAADNIWTAAMIEAGKISDRERRTVALAEVLPTPPAGAA